MSNHKLVLKCVIKLGVNLCVSVATIYTFMMIYIHSVIVRIENLRHFKVQTRACVRILWF